MALSNAERQRRWRDKRNDLAQILVGTPNEICEAILRELGADPTRRLARALDKRLRSLRSDCPRCEGTGFRSMQSRTACGMPIAQLRIRCDCPQQRNIK